LDPDYGWAGLAWTHLADVWLRSSDSPEKSIKQALKIAENTSKGWSKGEIHDFMSRVYYMQRQYDKAIAEAKKAIDLVPNSSRYLIGLADVLNHAARPEEAIVYAKRAMRLEPYYPAWFQGDVLAVSYAQAGRHEEVLEVCKQLLERAFKGEYPIAKAHRRLTGVYASLNRMEEARAHCTGSLKIDPNFSVEKWRKKGSFFFKDQKWIDSSAEMLIKAGFPE
jgi:tetratricopeptide (TPR) repeat protein